MGNSATRSTLALKRFKYSAKQILQNLCINLENRSECSTDLRERFSFPQYEWVGWLIPKQGPNRPFRPEFHPKVFPNLTKPWGGQVVGSHSQICENSHKKCFLDLQSLLPDMLIFLRELIQMIYLGSWIHGPIALCSNLDSLRLCIISILSILTLLDP